MNAKITFVDNRGASIPMRSRLEAKWAIFFSHCGLEWAYEPLTFVLPDRQVYTPDFYLPDVGWLEIKATVADAQAAEAKLRTFARHRKSLIPETKRTEFYTICAPEPRFDVGRVHRWDPHPIEFERLADVYTLFFSTHEGDIRKEFNSHPIEFVKISLLAAQRHDFNPVRLFPEGVLEWRCDALGASFRWLSKAFVAGVNAPLSRRELRALEALPSDEEWGCFTDWNGRC